MVVIRQQRLRYRLCYENGLRNNPNLEDPGCAPGLRSNGSGSFPVACARLGMGRTATLGQGAAQAGEGGQRPAEHVSESGQRVREYVGVPR